MHSPVSSGFRRAVVGLLSALVIAAGWLYYDGVRKDAEVHQRSGLLMGTFVNLRAGGRAAPAALDEAMAELDRLERVFSYNLPDSEVSRLNSAAGQGPVTVSPEMILVLSASQRVAQLSAGRFDVTVAPLVDVWGFRPDITTQVVPSPEAVEAARALVDYRQLRVDAAAGQAQLLRPGMRIDLGGVAKGYAVDRIVTILQEAGVKSGLIDVGGNIHAIGVRPNGQAWRVGLQHPRQTDALLGVMPLTDLSVATSGDYQRFFEADGQRYHHIIDPMTGYPARAAESVSVIAATGIEADAVSTAAFVLGPQAGLALVRQMGLEAVLFTLDGQLQVTGGLQTLFEVQQ